jgi:hypothetical protein
MTPTLNPSRSIERIADRAMLVSLTINQFNPVKTDKKITAEVATAHGSEVTMGRYAKSVIAKSALDRIRTLAGEVRQEHYRRTLPWSEDGARILTAQGFEEYSRFIRAKTDEWDAAVREFLDNWDSYVDDARVKLNGLFNAADYPPLDKVRQKFALKTSVKPVPVADDFRVALGASEVSAIKRQLTTELEGTVDAAMRSVWVQMRDVVAKMVERLKAYNPSKPSEAPFRDTLVTNVRDLLDILPTLNLTADPTVVQFAEDMRELVKYDASDLRDSQWRREDTARRAESILDAMSQFIA